MPEVILDGLGNSNTLKIDSNNAANIVGSVAITNASISVDVTVADYVSVTQSGAYLTTMGSVYQSTNPWIVLGSVQVTNPTTVWTGIGSTIITNTVPVSGTITVSSENVPYDSNEQLVFTAGSPTLKTSVFTGGVVKCLTVKCDKDTYIAFDASATSNSFLVYAGEGISANFQVGSVSSLYKSVLGSVWVWGGR